MAQPIATLLIEMAADVARLRSDMSQAQKTVGDAMKGIESTVDGAKRAFGLLAGAIGVASFTGWIKSSIDAADETGKLAQKIGIASSELAGLELAFKLGGAGGDVMEKSMIRLSITMNESAQKIQQLGINTKNTDGTLRSSTEVLRDIADRFASMDDGARKTALAVEIFGKAGAQMIPILNAGSAGLDEMDKIARQLGLTIDDETAKAAEQFNDTLDLLKTAVGGVARQATADLLPSLVNMASALLKATTETGALRTAGDLLGIVLKSLFSAVMGVAEALNSVATIASATWQAFMAATRGDFSTAVDIIQKAGTDVSNGWAKTSEIIRGAWSGSANAAISATATIVGEARRNQDAALLTAEAQKEMEAAAKKAQAEYEKLASSLDKATISALAEADAGGKLTDAKKLELDVRAKLNDSTIKLTASQRQEIETKLAAAMAALNDRDAQKAADDARKALTQTIGKEITEIEKQIEAQKKSNEEAGLSREQIQRLEIQRLRDAAAIADRNAQLRIESGINDEITAQYKKQADGLRQLADQKEAGIAIEIAQQSAKEWEKVTKQIEDGLTDALMRAFESGKGFMDAFRDTLRNAFRTLVLQPTIRAIMAPIAGAMGGAMGGMPGVAGAAGAGGGGGGGLLGNIGTIAGVGGIFGSAVAGGLAAYAGGLGSVAGLTYGGFSALGSSIAAGSFAGIAASLGTLVGTLGPIAIALAVLVKGFSRGPKQTTATGIQGSIGFGGVDGQQFTDWIRKGGWFRSDKRGTDLAKLSAETEAALDRTAAAVFSQANTYAETLGLSNVALQRVMTSFRVELGQSEEENEKAITAVFEQYRQDLAASFRTLLVPFQRAGETLADTFARLAAIQTFARGLNEFGGVFSRIAQLSVNATEELLSFAGGMEAFIQKTQSFVSNFYTQEEQIGLQARSIQQDLARLGITQEVSTRAQFRQLVESQDISTTRGREIFNALLDISQRFAPVASYLEENARTLSQAAASAPTAAILKNILDATNAGADGDADRDFYDWYRENWGGYSQSFIDQNSAAVEFYQAWEVDAEARAKLEKEQAEIIRKMYEQNVSTDRHQAEMDTQLLAETQRLLYHTGRMDWHTQANLIGLNEQAHAQRVESIHYAQLAHDLDSRYYQAEHDNNVYVNQFNDRLLGTTSVMQSQTNSNLTALNDRIWWLDNNNKNDQQVIIGKLDALNATSQAGFSSVVSMSRETRDLLDSWDDNGRMRVTEDVA